MRPVAIEDYLASPEAIRDVRALLSGRCVLSGTGCVIMCGDKGAWQFVGMTHAALNLDAYYRPVPGLPARIAAALRVDSAPHYVVHDNGRGMAIWRMRTGKLHMCDADRAEVRAHLDALPDPITWSGEVLAALAVPERGLPAAICLVLRASHHIATWGTP